MVASLHLGVTRSFLSMATLCVLLCFSPALATASSIPCQVDGSLEEAAIEVLASERPVGAAELVDIVRRAGSGVPSVRGLRLMADDRVLISEWVRQTAEELEAPVVCGVARDEDGVLVLAGARLGSLRIDTRPELRVQVSLDEQVHSPHLVIRDGGGEMIRLGLSEDEIESGIALPDGLRSPVRVQLMAVGERGPMPVAERVILLERGSHDQHPSSERLERGSENTGSGREWVGAIRDARGVAVVRSNRLLREVAQAHAADVCASGRVGHELVPGADPEVRLRRRGVRARVVGEVVARASSREAAREALLRSPSHHLTLVDERFTDVGYGEVQSQDDQTCTVVLLAAWPRVVPR